MKAPLLIALTLGLAATTSWAGQPTSSNFYPVEKIKPFTTFLGFDRDKQEMQELETLLQNSGANWHCISDAQRLRCPLNGDTGAPGSNVYFRAPHVGDNGATVSEFHVTMLTDDHAALAQLQPSVVAATLLGLEWNSIVFALGKPTNEYDDGTTVQHLYCAARDLPSKPGEPHVARIYTMYINSSRNMNVVTAVELTVIDQFLPPLAKPSC